MIIKYNNVSRKTLSLLKSIPSITYTLITVLLAGCLLSVPVQACGTCGCQSHQKKSEPSTRVSPAQHHDTSKHYHAPHKHGEATVSIVIQANQLALTLSLPANTIVGFEHKPTTPQERQEMDAARKRLSQPGLFAFWSKQGVFNRLKQVNIVQTTPVVAVNYTSDHAELTVTIESEHHALSSITALSTQLFTMLPELTVIDATIINGDQSVHRRWTPQSGKLELSGAQL